MSKFKKNPPGFRCVGKKDKALSLGLTYALTCLLSYLPAGVFFGYLYDQTCLLWSSEGDEEGNCWVYDTVKMR